MNWLWQNREWLFSGIGVTVLACVALLLRKTFVGLFRKGSDQAAVSTAPLAGGVNANSTGSPIAVGSNITQTISVVGASATPPTGPYSSDPKPSELLRALQDTPLYHRESIARSYVGLMVRWTSQLSGLSSEDEPTGLRRVVLRTTSADSDQAISFTTSIEKYPRLKTARHGDPLEVSGKIEWVASEGSVIHLTEVQIVFLPRDGSGLESARTASSSTSGAVTKTGGGLHLISKISFGYLPQSPLDHDWAPADQAITPSQKFSRPENQSEGLKWAASPHDAIDFALEPQLRICNQLKFMAKLTDGAHVYAKVRLKPEEANRISKVGWISCDVGYSPPRKVPGDEWVIFRPARDDGWASFDLYLPQEVNRTFGQYEGLQFEELLGLRLRGSLSVSPIDLYRVSGQ